MRSIGWALLAWLICATAEADNMQRGVDLPLYNSSVNMTQLAQSLAEFKADGGQYVAVNVWWFQDNINSTVIAPNYSLYSTNDATTVSVIQAIQAAGLQAALKPIVDMANPNGSWRGDIPGGSAWFTGTSGTNGYNAFIEHYATMAAQNNVSLFVVGTELADTQSDTTDWTNLITAVKGIYKGPLTYAANWNSGSAVIENPVAWWGSLNYIGIDAYYPMPNSPTTTLSQLNAAWASQASTINSWWNALPASEQKPVLFTEVGYGNQDSSGATNLQLQANDYKALLSNLWEKEPWFEGAYWWDWTPTTPPESYDNLIFQGTPAEQVMASYYTVPEPATWALALAGLTSLGIIALRKRGTSPCGR